MAVYYVSSTVSGTTVGTADTIGDPYGIEYVLSSGNSASVAAGDEIVLLTDGTYSVGVGLHTPIAGSLTTGLVTVRSGDPTTGTAVSDQAIIDFNTLATGNQSYYHNQSGGVIFGLDIRNGYGTAFRVGSNGNRSMFIHLKSTDAVGDGFDSLSGPAATIWAYCQAYTSGSKGFDIQGSAFNNVVLWRCHAEDNSGSQIQVYCNSGQNTVHAVLECTTFLTGAGSSSAMFSNSRSATFLDSCTGVAEAATATFSALSVDNTYGGAFLNCLAVLNATAAAGTEYGFIANSASNKAAVFGGNNFYDTDGRSIASGADPVIDLDNGTDSSTDPSFTSSADITPTADLSGIAKPRENIGSETDHFIPGAIPAATAAGTAAASSIFCYPIR